jgi:hypothetical protein
MNTGGVKEQFTARSEAYIRRCSQKSPAEGALPGDLYLAFMVIFRDLGLRVVESSRLTNLHSYLLVSPAGATVVVDARASDRDKVFRCAHALMHVILGHGGDEEWYILRDYADESMASEEERVQNNEAGEYAQALLGGQSVAVLRRISGFRRALLYVSRRRLGKDFVRESLRRLQRLHRFTQDKVPGLNELIKRVPFALELCHSARCVLEESERQSGRAYPVLVLSASGSKAACFSNHGHKR